jgi:hypothetical protein
MDNLKDKIKFIELAQKLKKNIISYDEAIKELFQKKEFKCCENIVYIGTFYLGNIWISRYTKFRIY